MGFTFWVNFYSAILQIPTYHIGILHKSEQVQVSHYNTQPFRRF